MCFFFSSRRRHTRWPRDWSSDVCSSDLYHFPVIAAFRRQDVFPNNHELYAGHLGLGTHKNILETVKEADVILALATRLRSEERRVGKECRSRWRRDNE